MQRLSYPTETVLSNKITRNRIVLSFKDSLRKPLRRRPREGGEKAAHFLFSIQTNKDAAVWAKNARDRDR